MISTLSVLAGGHSVSDSPQPILTHIDLKTSEIFARTDTSISRNGRLEDLQVFVSEADSRSISDAARGVGRSRVLVLLTATIFSPRPAA